MIPALYGRVSILGDRTFLVAGVEAVIVFVAVCCALLLHLGKVLPVHLLLSVAMVIVPVRLAALYCCNLMRGWWRYTGLREILNLMYAIALGSIVLLGLRLAGMPNTGLGFAFFFLEPIVAALLLGLARMLPRVIFDMVLPRRTPRKQLVVLGAGSGANLIIRELHQPDAMSTVLACLDDNPTKKGIRIGGVLVEGGCDLLPQIVQKYHADEVWVAIPSATPPQLTRLVDICAKAGVPYRTLPCVRDIVDGQLVRQLRAVKLEDLLGRDPVDADLAIVRRHVQDRVIMVTGAAGSIGSELCLQLLRHHPAGLICLDQSETGMFYLELNLKKAAGLREVHYYVADVCNGDRVQRILRKHKVEVIFHAAAYKHVPIMERNIEEALHNNVFSLLQLLEIAESAGVRSFCMISSDKAVNPTNVMGTTKRIGELILRSRPSGKLSCVSVRFGNVLGSNGSVVPILQEQIRLNSAITITHPEIKRFFMTITEAVSLVLQAYAIGQHGDLLVLDMGKPMRIVDLARHLIRLSGKTEHDVPIRFIGLREGEKLTEELFYKSEKVTLTDCAKVLRTRSALHSWSRLNQMLLELRQVIDSGDPDLLKIKMKAIVPEYEYLMTEAAVANIAVAEIASVAGRVFAEADAEAPSALAVDWSARLDGVEASNPYLQG